MLRTILAGLGAMILAVGASAQTTQPSKVGDAPGATAAAVPADAPAGAVAALAAGEQAWPATVEAFAKALTAGDLPATEAMLSARATVKRFDVAFDGELSRMVGRVAHSTVVGQHAYLHPPLVMAADVAADFKNAAAIPEKAKARYLIDEDSEMKRANATAVQWVVEQLDARAGTPVGVIVLWTPRPVTPGVGSAEAAAGYDVVFVLCRGEEVAPREFKINAVIYGNPIPDANH